MNIYVREIKHMFKKTILDDKNKSIAMKWKQSILAVFLALVLASILIMINGYNPLYIFRDIIIGATNSTDSWRQTWVYLSMFMLAGTSIIVGFKAGLFNIGIGGQMLISGATIMILAVKYSLPWPLLLIIGMGVAGAAASISGVLKALFNIHEVVSTILINWVFFYISQYMLGDSQSWMDGFGTTKAISEKSRMIIGDNIALPAIIVSISLLVLAIVFFRFTKWGFALKQVGENTGAAEYSGIKVVYQLALGMALSGIAAGALAATNYLGKFGSMSKAVSISLPSIGFQGISVALISFNSLYGLIPAAFFWAIITSGTDYSAIINPGIPKEILSLMNGLIIYAIAISIIFIRFRPIRAITYFIIRIRSKEIQSEIKKYRKAIKSEKSLIHNSSIKVKENFDDKQWSKESLDLKKRLKNVDLELERIKKEFINKNPRPKIYQRNYSSNLKKWEKDLYNKQLEIIDKREILEKEYKILQNNALGKKLKYIKRQQKTGMKILANEHKARITKYESEILKKSIIGQWISNLKKQRELSNQFLSKLSILKLEKNRAIKEIQRTTKNKKHIEKIIERFEKNVMKLENQSKGGQ